MRTAVTIGVYTFELHLPGARSLKNKRQVVRRLKDRLRSRHNVAVAEVADHADRWQRASLAVVSVASGRDALERLFEAVHREVELHVPGQVIETGTEYIDAADGGSRGWNGDWS
jgi:uncharacterized protein YlxP (DUF503 family)